MDRQSVCRCCILRASLTASPAATSRWRKPISATSPKKKIARADWASSTPLLHPGFLFRSSVWGRHGGGIRSTRRLLRRRRRFGLHYPAFHFLLARIAHTRSPQKDDDLRACTPRPKAGGLVCCVCPASRCCLTIGFVVNFAFFNFQTTYALWMEKVLFPGANAQFVQASIGTVLTIVGIAGIITQFLVSGSVGAALWREGDGGGRSGLARGGVGRNGICQFIFTRAHRHAVDLVWRRHLTTGDDGIAHLRFTAGTARANDWTLRIDSRTGAHLGSLSPPVCSLNRSAPTRRCSPHLILTCVAALLCIPLWRIEF